MIKIRLIFALLFVSLGVSAQTNWNAFGLRYRVSGSDTTWYFPSNTVPVKNMSFYSKDQADGKFASLSTLNGYVKLNPSSQQSGSIDIGGGINSFGLTTRNSLTFDNNTSGGAAQSILYRHSGGFDILGYNATTRVLNWDRPFRINSSPTQPTDVIRLTEISSGQNIGANAATATSPQNATSFKNALATSLQDAKNVSGEILHTGTGTYGVQILGNSVATNVLQAGQSGVSNGFTVQYDGSQMQYTFNDGVVQSNAALRVSSNDGNPTSVLRNADKSVANGVASLDGSGRVPASQLPSGTTSYVGTWNASTNTPALANGTGTAGSYYIVNVAGTQNLGAGSVNYAVGDNVIYNGTIWDRIPNSGGVTSVNGQTGSVVLTTSNINEGSNLYYTDDRVNANANVAANTASRHSAVTLNGTPNGLSLSGQQLSLATANGTTTGALTGADWTTFNSKGNGTVTNVSSANSDISVSNNSTTPVITLSDNITSNTSGNALTSTTAETANKFAGIGYEGALSSVPTYLMGFNGATSKFGVATNTQAKAFLSTNLQDVLSANNTASLGANFGGTVTSVSTPGNPLAVVVNSQLSGYATTSALAGKQNTLTLTTSGSGPATLNVGTGSLNIPTPVIPTNTNQLTNGAGFITNTGSTTGKATGTTLQDARNAGNSILSTGTSSYGLQVLGNSGATSILQAGQSGISNGFTVKYDGSAMQYDFNNGNITVDGSIAATPSSGNSNAVTVNSQLSGYALTSAIPTQTSQLTNNSGFITSSALTGYATQAYADAKVQNSLTASTTVAPSATAVNGALAQYVSLSTNQAILARKDFEAGIRRNSANDNNPNTVVTNTELDALKPTIDEEVTETQTNATLNGRFSTVGVGKFVIYPNVGTGMMYIKTSTTGGGTWRAVSMTAL